MMMSWQLHSPGFLFGLVVKSTKITVKPVLIAGEGPYFKYQGKNWMISLRADAFQMN